MMNYVALNHWLIFQTNFTRCRGAMARKAPKSTQKRDFLLVGKHLKIHNLPTTNPTPMKLTTIMYLHETFYLDKNWSVIHRA